MILDLLRRHARDRGAAAFLLTSSRTWTYADVAHDVARLAGKLDAHGIVRCGIYAQDSAEIVVLALACAVGGVDACIFSRAATPTEVESLVRRFSLPVLFADTDVTIGPAVVTPVATVFGDTSWTSTRPPADRQEGRLIVLTTGTTGDPKGAVYRWSDLCAQVGGRPEGADRVWLLAYHLNHFAGLHMLAHVLVNGAALAIPATADIDEAIVAIERHRIGGVSATPTFWRLLLGRLSPGRPAPALRQITLGGEAASPDLIAALAARFPGARISQVFATTEVGSCLSVQDGQLGFPASLLDRADDAPVQLKIVDGQLYVRSPHGMRGYYGEPELDEQTWRATGDLVEVRGDRINILGRATETINVGGVKVHPLPVEARVLAVPGVRLARVRGVPNPVTGQVVGVDVVAEAGADLDALDSRIRAACADLARPSRPRAIRFVETLETANRKIIRRQA